MKFEFKNADNGVVLEYEYYDENGTLVYQCPDVDCQHESISRFADFLWQITDRFGPTTSRYSKERIMITVEPGDKYEEKE